MKNFSWNYFSQTGEVESYLLYKNLMKTKSLPGDASADIADQNQEL